jgi:O-antigen ligase
LWDLNPDEEGEVPIRSPHNAFMHALGYTGWVGVALFTLLQVTLVRLLWQVYRQTNQPIGLSLWAFAMVRAQFDGYFDIPYLTIPFFMLIGLTLAPLVAPQYVCSPSHSDDPANPLSSLARRWKPV